MFRVRKCGASSCFLLTPDCSGSRAPILSCESEDLLFHFCKKSTWNFDRNCTEITDYLGEYWHLNNIKSMNTGCLSTFYSFTVQVSQFWVRLIPKYVIYSGAIVSGIVLFISYLESSLQVHRNLTDTCHWSCILLIWQTCLLDRYRYTSLPTYIYRMCGFFSVFCILIYKMMSSVNRDGITSSFPTWMPFLFFLLFFFLPCLVVLARTSSTLLKVYTLVLFLTSEKKHAVSYHYTLAVSVS